VGVIRKNTAIYLVAGSLALVCSAVSSIPASADNTQNQVLTWYGDQGQERAPETVGGLPTDISIVQAGNFGGLAVDSAGKVYQWDSSSDPTASQVAITASSHVVAVGEGAFYGAGVLADGTVWTWGNDRYGELCNGKTSDQSLAPQRVKALKGIVAAFGGGNHLLLLASDGTVETCGHNSSGDLGDGKMSSGQSADSDVPVKVRNLRHVVAISAGQTNSMALDASGNVWSWGDNNFGQLGDGNTTNSDIPVEVQLPATASEIYAGGDDSMNGQQLALLTNGQVWMWGNDVWGQLGNGEKEPYSDTPVEVQGLPDNVVYAITGGTESFALDSDGNVWGWGNYNGLTPAIVATGVTQISAVAEVFVAIQPNGDSSSDQEAQG
jgi:alpha-tubulin suppressor-like RCC1 family protein